MKVVLKVALQDLALVLGWVFAAPFLSMIINPLPLWLFSILFVAFVVLYFLLLFFSNAELFGWVKNDYAWSLSTGAFTLLIFVVPSVMWVSHNNICQVIQGAIT